MGRLASGNFFFKYEYARGAEAGHSTEVLINGKALCLVPFQKRSWGPLDVEMKLTVGTSEEWIRLYKDYMIIFRPLFG